MGKKCLDGWGSLLSGIGAIGLAIAAIIAACQTNDILEKVLKIEVVLAKLTDVEKKVDGLQDALTKGFSKSVHKKLSEKAQQQEPITPAEVKKAILETAKESGWSGLTSAGHNAVQSDAELNEVASKIYSAKSESEKDKYLNEFLKNKSIEKSIQRVGE